MTGNVVFDVLVRPVEQLRWAATTLVETVSQQLGGNAGSTSSAAGTVIARLQSASVEATWSVYRELLG